MTEAEKIAAEFIRVQRPEAAVAVRNAELKSSNRWTIVGIALERTPLGGSATDWIVDIENENVVSYNFMTNKGLPLP
jgi:hypothetical protein